MNKYLLVIIIKPEELDKYIEIHKNAGKKLLEDVRSCGFLNESAWIYKNLSIVYFETNKSYDECNKFLRSKQSCKQWDKIVIPLFEESPIFADKIFDLNEQLSKFVF